MSLLLKIWQGVIEAGQNKINLKNLDLTYGQRSKITQLRFHALVAKAKNEEGRHILATWLITKRGADFLHGRISIPKYVLTFQNEVIDHAEELISRADFRALENFNPTYEIIENHLVITAMSQAKLI